MKHKRVWTDEQRQAAAERMRKTQKIRWAKIRAIEDVNSGESPMAVVATMEKVLAPEVQVVIETMTPERKAKLEAIQARNLANLAQTKEGQEALARFEASKGGVSVSMSDPGVVIPPRPGSYELSLIVRNDGTMVSQYGPCVCGAAKREWHKICLKETNNHWYPASSNTNEG